MQQPRRRDLAGPEIGIVVCGDAALLIPHGDMDFVCSDAMAATLAAAVAEGWNVTVDLGNVSFVDARGVSVFATAAQELRQQGRRLRCVDAQPLARRVFGLMGQSHLLRP